MESKASSLLFSPFFFLERNVTDLYPNYESKLPFTMAHEERDIDS